MDLPHPARRIGAPAQLALEVGAATPRRLYQGAASEVSAAHGQGEQLARESEIPIRLRGADMDGRSEQPDDMGEAGPGIADDGRAWNMELRGYVFGAL
jgi:hypothetical protein